MCKHRSNCYAGRRKGEEAMDSLGGQAALWRPESEVRGDVVVVLLLPLLMTLLKEIRFSPPRSRGGIQSCVSTKGQARFVGEKRERQSVAALVRVEPCRRCVCDTVAAG